MWPEIKHPAFLPLLPHTVQAARKVTVVTPPIKHIVGGYRLRRGTGRLLLGTESGFTAVC